MPNTHLHYKIARITLTLLSLLFLLPAQAATYYFSSSQGDDSRSMQQAQNPATPLRSIAKLNAIFYSLNAGDEILFKRGDTFEGSIIISESGVSGNPITFSAYGSGDQPVISGFTGLTNWVNVGNGVWETSLSSETSTLNLVTINEVAYAMGRYPNSSAANKGYLTIDNASGTSSITDNQLSSYPNWTGAEVVIRKNRWIIDRNKVTAHSGTIINYSTASSYNASKGYGYFIQNHPSTLDTFGEWYYNKTSGKLLIFFGSSSPYSYRVKASRKEIGVSFKRNNYIKFDNLAFQGFNFRTFETDNTTDISITNCNITFSGGEAIGGMNTKNFLLENSVIDNALNNGIGLNWQCPNATIRNNQVKNIGYMAGMGQSGNFTYQAIMAMGDNALIEGNSIINNGYVPLSFRGNNSIVRKNYVENFCYIKDDGGAIHTWNNIAGAVTLYGQKVTDNIIINGVGAPDGTANPDFYLAKGVYMDDNTANVEIARNTVRGCTYGLYVHNSRNLNIYNNTFFDNRQYQVLMEHDKVAADKPIRNVTFKSNILASEDEGQELMALFTKDNDIAQFGTFTNNYYTRTISTSVIAVNTVAGRYTSWQKNNSYNLGEWKKVYGFESSSVENKPLPHYQINQLMGGNKFPNKSFDSNISGVLNYFAGGSLKLSWDNSNKLNSGGSLKASFAYNSGNKSVASLRGNVGGIDKNKSYIVKFSVIGANADRTLEIGLVNNNVSNQYLVRRTFKSTTGRTDYEFLFEPNASTSSAALRFNFNESDGTLWFDNIEFHEADVSVDSKHVRLEHNPSNSTKTVSLGNTYLSAKLQTKSGSLSIVSFASEVLMKQSGSIEEPALEPEPTPTTSTCDNTGGITREYWSNVSGKSVSSIPVSQTPTSVTTLGSFETPSNIGDNYGQRIRGYICVPVTGNYTFYLAADDESELYLSLDDNHANKRKIASIDGWTSPRSWTKYSSQRSASYYLKVGEKYYIEALHKEALYGDNLAVAWIVPGTSAINVIPGNHLIPYSSSNARVASNDEQELKVTSNMTAYPNPFEDRLYIQTELRGDIQISLIDALGRVCYEDTKSVQESTIEIDLSQKNLSKGVYFVKLEGGKEANKVIRVVKK